MGSEGPTDLAEHRRHYTAPDAHRDRAAGLVARAGRARLRGRGGAGFPTATKMQAVAARRGRAVVVANGTEGEPLSRKDVTLMMWQPHLVLDGAELAAMAVAADTVYVCIERTQTATIAAMERALQERTRCESPSLSISLRTSPPRYVAGEESALVHWLNGGEARPTNTPPRPFESGVGGRPTLVDNVETLAHFAQIAAFGDEWFRQVGTQAEPGTALLSASGAVERPAVYETPLGTRLATLIDHAGPTHGIGAVLVGGYFGGWLDPATAARVRVCDEDLRRAGCGVGCGAVAVLPADGCGVMESARILTWMAHETAGQCGPCVNGLAAIAGTWDAIASGRAGTEHIRQLERWAGQIEGRGACKLPDGAIRFLHSALRVFASDLERHARRAPCLGARRPGLLPVPQSQDVWR
ncbi:MAG TPA: NADH-ubiquinone oxidoreductase-F iron-sulfur binding region domain-containing protein [Acidimicrobiia bacterium]